MTATINLSEEEIQDLRDLTKVTDLPGALHYALDEYRRYARRMRLKELSGQIAMDDNWRSLETAETDGRGPRRHLHLGSILQPPPHFDLIAELKRFRAPR
jgi:hypothetical protein